MASSQPLYSQLYDVLAQRIPSGVWEEGERVPSEQALVAESGTPRGPVRQALARLRAEGLVAIVRLRLLDGEPVMFERSVYVIEAGRHVLAADLDANSIIYHVLRTHGSSPRVRTTSSMPSPPPRSKRRLEVEIGTPLLRAQRRTRIRPAGHPDIADNRYLPDKATFAVDNTTQGPNPLARITVNEVAPD